MTSGSIRIVVVDDHPLVRESLAMLLANERDLVIVGSCADADAGAALARAEAPDVILMDIEMPGRSAFQVARELRRDGLKTRCIFLSAFLTDSYLQEALDLGTYGYLLKSSSIDEIARAIRTVAAGESYLSAEAASRLPDGAVAPAGPATTAQTSRLGRLTTREREVLRLVASDLSCKEIAVKLGLSARTIDRHKANIMEKLDIHSQVGLTRFAVAEGVCDPRARV